MLDLIRVNFEEKAGYAARTLPAACGMRVTDEPAYLAVDCGLPSDTYNVVVPREPIDAMYLRDSAITPFRAKGFPLAIWCFARSAELMQTFALAGFRHAESSVAMVADLTCVAADAALPHGLSIVYADGPRTMSSYGSFLADQFSGRERLAIGSYFEQLSAFLQLLPSLRHYVGMLGGEVVATGSLYIGSATSGIYDVITREDLRGRGIGSAMFAYLLGEAKRERHRTAVLQASDAGQGIYRRAGFVTVGEVQVFEPAPSQSS